MASDDELQRQKKIFLPYLDRAEEIKAVNAKIAYYCRLYALDQTVTKIGPKNMVPVVKAVIESVAKELEKTQPNLNLNRETDKVECEQFAKMVFARADKLDRLGTGHAATRTTFYNAWLFFNVASQFDGLSLEAQKLQKYAGWRATAIQKALKAGVTPEPPPVEGAALDAQADEELMTALNSLPDIPGSAAPPSPTATTKSSAVGAPPPSPHFVKAPATGPQPKLPPRTFFIGQDVWFCRDGSGNCVKKPGKIIGTKPGTEPSTTMYVVDLGGQQVVVREELLAQRIDAGATVDYYPDQGDREEVEVEEVFGSRWPPVYLVKRQRGGLAEAADDRLVADRLPSAAPAVFPRPAAHSLPEPPTVPFVPERQESEAAGGVSGAYGETRPPPTGPAVCPVPSAEDLAAMSEPTEDEIAAFKPDPSLPAALGGVPPPPPSPIVTSILAGKAEALAPAPAPEEPPAAPVAPPSPPAMPPSPPPVKAPSPPLPPPPAPAPAPTYAVAALPMVAPAPAFTPAPAPALVPPASIPQPTPGFEPSLAAATEAQKHAKQAASALSFDDIPTAIANLTSALRLLTGSKT